jgi:hypothetical protein
MNIAWTKHCKSVEEKEQYTNSLMRAKWVLDDLSKLVDSNYAASEVAETSVKAYDNPNWQYRQADMNGYKRALRDFKNLINLDQEHNGRQPS